MNGTDGTPQDVCGTVCNEFLLGQNSSSIIWRTRFNGTTWELVRGASTIVMTATGTGGTGITATTATATTLVSQPSSLAVAYRTRLVTPGGLSLLTHNARLGTSSYAADNVFTGHLAMQMWDRTFTFYSKPPDSGSWSFLTTDVVALLNPTDGFRVVAHSSEGLVGADSYGSKGVFAVRPARGSYASPTNVNSGDELGGLEARAHDGFFYPTTPSASVTFVATENHSGAGRGTSIQLRTTPVGSTTAVTRVTVGADGVVTATGAVNAASMGASSATFGSVTALTFTATGDEVMGVTSLDGHFTRELVAQMFYAHNMRIFETGIAEFLQPGTSPTGSRVDISSPGNDPGLSITRGNGAGGVLRRFDIKVASDSSFVIRDNNASVDRIFLTSSGNVGVGTSIPQSLLDVLDTLQVRRAFGYNVDATHTLLALGPLSSDKNFAVTSAFAFRVRSNAAGVHSTFSLSEFRSADYSNSGRTLPTTSLTDVLLVQGGNVGIGITPSSLLTIGNSALNGANAFEVRLGSTAVSSAFRVGQGAANNAFLAWSYDATAANAFVELGTWANSNRVRIAGSNVEFAPGGTVRATILGVNGNMGIGIVPGSAARLDLQTTIGSPALRITSGPAGAGSGYIQIGQSATATNNFYIGGDGNGNFIFARGIYGTPTLRAQIDTAGHFVPGVHNTYDLGTTAVRWREAWVQRGAFNGSDRKLKRKIKRTRFGLDFIRRLRPVSYQWINTDGGDTARHHGFIAQEVKEVLTDLNATSQDFGGYLDPKDRNQTGDLALAYTEFLSPLVAAVQELDLRWGEVTETIKPSSPCVKGAQRYTEGYLYVCVASNRWNRLVMEKDW